MQGGFSFCGVDIAKFGLEYVPPLNQTYVFAGGTYDVHQESFDAHDGGYFYGTTVQPKDFVLRCFFQDAHIAHGSLAAIENFFRRGRTGRLVFEHREWIWYTATVVSVNLNDLRNYKNGFVTITLRAYYPFARHDYISIGENNEFADHIASNTGLLTSDETPEVSFSQILNDVEVLLYNGGSENAAVAIAIAGNAGEGVTIENKTTKQSARFVAFTKSDTTDIGRYIVSDGLNGKTVITDGESAQMCFLYHDYGFIELKPSFPISRDVYVSYSEGDSYVSIMDIALEDDVVGKYIRINGHWLKITAKENGKLFVSSAIQESGFEYTNIVTMNEIEIKLGIGAELTKLDFIYKPTFQ